MVGRAVRGHAHNAGHADGSTIHCPPSHAHIPSQEAPAALGQKPIGGSLAPRPPYDPRSSVTITPISRTGPCNAPPRRSCETLDRRDQRAPASVCAAGQWHAPCLLCTLSCVCHNTMYPSQDTGAAVRFWVNCRGGGSVSSGTQLLQVFKDIRCHAMQPCTIPHRCSPASSTLNSYQLPPLALSTPRQQQSTACNI